MECRLLIMCLIMIGTLATSVCGIHRHQVLARTIRMSSSFDSTTVIGSGPAGLCTAIMLAKRGYSNIKLYDKLSEPPSPNSTVWEDLNADRAYNIGINGRGQNALRYFGVMPRIEKFATTVVGRMDWTPESPVDEPRELIFGTQKSYLTKCIQRDRLTACLLEEIREEYSTKIKVYFNTECKNVQWIDEGKPTEKVLLQLCKEEADTPPIVWKEEANFVIGADGAQSAIRTAMEIKKENGFFHKKFEDKNVRVYRTIPLYFPKDSKKWRGDVNYSARTKSDVNLDALPTTEGPYVGVVLFRPWDTRLTDMKTASDARNFFNSIFPMFSPFIDDKDLVIFAKKIPSKLPKFSYSGPVLHKGKTTVLVGDSIHTVKPYFGMGVNSAFEDIYLLDNALNKTNNIIDKAIKIFSNERAKDTKSLVHMSRKLDGGFFSFVLPLIIDTILHNLAPWLFSPNSISSLQNEKLKFSQIQKRKRLDRVLQFGFGLALLASVWKGTNWISKIFLNLISSKKTFFFKF
eukprot:gene3810-7580_t